MKNAPSPNSNGIGADYPITLGSTWARNCKAETWSLRYERKSLSAAVPSKKSGESIRRGTLELEAGNASAVALNWESSCGEKFSGQVSGANAIDCVLIYNPEHKSFELQRLAQLVTSLRPASAAAPRGIKPATPLAPVAAAARKRKIGSDVGGVTRSLLGGNESARTDKRQRARSKMADAVTELHAILNTVLPVSATEKNPSSSIAERREGRVREGESKMPRGRAPAGKAWNSFTGEWEMQGSRNNST